jgi:hypothetical protein
MVTGDATEQVGGSFGLEMDVVTAHVRVTLPVKPPPGVTVMVEVFPVVAPAVTEILPLLVSAMVGVVVVFDTVTVKLADDAA